MSNEVPSTGRYRVITTGPKCWYAMEIATRKLGPTHRTKRSATQACADRNLPIAMKQAGIRAADLAQR